MEPKLEPKLEPEIVAEEGLGSTPKPELEPKLEPDQACSSAAPALKLEPKFEEQDVWDLFPAPTPRLARDAANRDKIIIFSQWTSMLNLLEGPLNLAAYV